MEKEKGDGTMLLALIASLATTLNVDPKKAAKSFSGKMGDGKKWLVDFTLECTKLALEMDKNKK